MKFVKDRKVYDTDTADAIHSWEEPDDQELFATSYNEVLYRSPKGTLFLHTERQEDIQLMDINEAAAWLDTKNAPPKAYGELDINLQEW